MSARTRFASLSLKHKGGDFYDVYLNGMPIHGFVTDIKIEAKAGSVAKASLSFLVSDVDVDGVEWKPEVKAEESCQP